MKTKFQVLHLMTIDDTFNPCIVIPFPKGGMIKDYFTAKNEGYILVQSDVDAVMESAHFHAVGLEQITYTDTLEYVGLFKFDKIVEGYDLTVIPIIRIPEGGFGITSVNYIAEHGYTKPRDEEFTVKPATSDFTPLTKEELYQLFDLDTPEKKEQKKHYNKKRKDDTVE